VAGRIIERLLAAGHTVRATVRDPSKEALLAPLRALPGATERLTFHVADLLKPGSFSEAVAGCKYVVHTASPFMTPSKQSDVQAKLLDPALMGTTTLLGARFSPSLRRCATSSCGALQRLRCEVVPPPLNRSPHPADAVNAAPSVQRVVLTSSCAAIYGDSHQSGAGVPFTEADWAAKTSPTYLPYYYSKKIAEEKAWEMQKAQSRYAGGAARAGASSCAVVGAATSPACSAACACSAHPLL